MNCTDKVYHEASLKVFKFVDKHTTYLKRIKIVRNDLKSCLVYRNGKELQEHNQNGEGVDRVDPKCIEKMQ